MTLVSAALAAVLATAGPAAAQAPVPAPAPAPAPNSKPVADFTVDTAVAVVGRPVTFTSTSVDANGTIDIEKWDLNGDGKFTDASGATVTWVFSTPGSHIVRLRVRDNLGATATASTTVLVDAPPTAAFASAPAVVTAGNSATFVSTSRDPDGSIARLEWDLDGDGAYDDGGAGTVTHTYATTGVVTVHLRVTDDRGVTDVATGTVTVVANQAPLASFVYTPAAPIVGLPVLFSSRSSDPDGSISAIAWDLDGDGAYDDASGGAASWMYRAAQNVMVSLRATDDRGASSVGFQTLSIRGSVATPDASTGPLPGLAPRARPPRSPLSPGARLLTPFPIVRIRGQIAGGLVSISLLSVQAPRGAKVVVRCRGRGCPRARIIAHTASPSRAMRVRAFEAAYRPGAQLQVFVSMPGRIGKYVSFVMRRSAAPTRRDLCVGPRRTTKPVRCPTR